MSDSIFLDTNILVYAYSDTELQKQTIARKLVSENISNLSERKLKILLPFIDEPLFFRI